MKNRKINTTISHSIMLALAAFFWGTTFVAQAMAGDYQGAYTFCCIRNVIAVFILIPVIKIIEKKDPTQRAPKTKEEKKSLLIGGIVTGIFLAGTAIFQQLGINMGTSAGKAGFLTACYIVFVPIIGIFLKRKCKLNVWISVVIALVGLYLLCIKDDFSIEPNDFSVLICSLSCALQIIAIDYYVDRVTSLVRLAQLEFLVCAIIAAVPMFIIDMGQGAGGISGWLQGFSSFEAWIPILYAAFLSSGVAYTLQIIGQKDLNPAVASLVMSLESVFSVLAGWIVLGERMSLKEGIGCVLIFAAIILSQVKRD